MRGEKYCFVLYSIAWVLLIKCSVSEYIPYQYRHVFVVFSIIPPHFVHVFHYIIWQLGGGRVNDLLWSTKTKVNWFLARPSLNWAVYDPSSSGDSWSNSISSRPLALSKLILRCCRKSKQVLPRRQETSTHVQTDDR